MVDAQLTMIATLVIVMFIMLMTSLAEAYALIVDMFGMINF